MKKALFATVLTLVTLGGIGLQAQNKPAEHYQDLTYSSLHKIQPPKPDRLVLPNGMTVYLVQDHELPMITVSALIRVGSRWEPVDKAGLADIVGTVMRTGGTATRNGDKLDEELDRLGAEVETGIGEDSGGATVSVLKEDINLGLDILADLLQHPAFPQDKIELAKIAHRDSIARRNDFPSGIVGREFRRILLGKDSPYAHQTEYATIDAIARDDLVAFHRQYFQPENVILGVWGDFGTEMRARIETVFGSWPKGGHPRPPVPEVASDWKKCAGLYQINKEDVNQSWVMMGQLAGRRDNPDYYALDLMNQILGDGFASRLFSRVRSAQGLAYAIGSSWAAGWDRPGVFTASGHTKSETTTKILASIKTEIGTFIEGGVSDEELQRVKDATLKGFAFEFDSTGKIVERLMRYDYYGYPSDYLQRYQENIGKVTRQDVARVAKQYLKPEQFVVLVLGNTKDFDRPLASVGAVKDVDITIPKPK
ncbi:MAG TPA: pitrilysin family protein [Candidatus Acidoferrum sp.]|jgi:zinc protease|nr:pitrilysin family protein [Candidatus Acidoferrum sp.]